MSSVGITPSLTGRVDSCKAKRNLVARWHELSPEFQVPDQFNCPALVLGTAAAPSGAIATSCPVQLTGGYEIGFGITEQQTAVEKFIQAVNNFSSKLLKEELLPATTIDG